MVKFTVLVHRDHGAAAPSLNANISKDQATASATVVIPAFAHRLGERTFVGLYHQGLHLGE